MENQNSSNNKTNKKMPICVIVVGMAGSGKTTLMQRLIKTAFINEKRPYILNLDPAVARLPYSCNIDIRDTVDYKGVMKDYKLGPNGSIMTSLNLFATRFDQVIQYIESKSDELDYVFVDTPGQIEVFTWSASGEIITELLASSMPTVLLYVVDTPRSSMPVTFMSNMLYACSIFYRLCLPLMVVFNKNDIEDSEKIDRWMKDYEYFHECISEVRSDSFILPLTHSLGLSLEEFYKTLNTVSVSSVTGEGCIDLFEAINASVSEYNSIYLPERQRRIKERQEREEKEEQAKILKMREDMLAEGEVLEEEEDTMNNTTTTTNNNNIKNNNMDIDRDMSMGDALMKEELKETVKEEEKEELKREQEEYQYQIHNKEGGEEEDDDDDNEDEEDENEKEEYDEMMKWIDKLKAEQKNKHQE
ncbi:hypothetical protein WA158_006212 [Blastocystis sp. Blastoise]